MIFNFCEKCGSVLTGTVKDESRPTCSSCLEWKSTINVSYEKQEMLNKIYRYYEKIIQSIIYDLTPKNYKDLLSVDFPTRNELEVFNINNNLSDSLANSLSIMSEDLLNQLVEITIKKLLFNIEKTEITFRRPRNLSTEDFKYFFDWISKSEVNTEFTEDSFKITVDFIFPEELRTWLFTIGVPLYQMSIVIKELKAYYHDYLESCRKPEILQEFREKFEDKKFENPLRIEKLCNKGELQYFLMYLKHKGYLCVEKPGNVIEITL